MRRRPILILSAVAVVAVLAAGIGIWWVFFSDDAPDAVDITAANEQLDLDLGDTLDDTGTDDASDATTTGSPREIDGVWTVDNTIGEFDFESASGSFAGFRVEEELTVGSTTAVGRTDAVAGTITVADGILTEAELTVELGGIVSNNSRRENAIQEALGTDAFPVTTFVLTTPVPLTDGLAAGETIEVDAVGDLTIHGITNSATFTLSAIVRDDGIAVVTGSSPVVFANYDVTAPSAPVVVSVEDNGIIELQLLLT